MATPAQWPNAKFPEYGLTKQILTNFLKGEFPGFSTDDFGIQFKCDHFHFRVPQLLTQTYSHRLRSYVDALDREQNGLFGAENDSEVYFWETLRDRNEFPANPECIKSVADVRRALPLIGQTPRDPIFIEPKGHSRAKLKITREMLTLILSYHQVMPEILEIVFPFGYQKELKEFHFITFRHSGHVHSRHKALDIPDLGRSGRFLQCCYNLESVEPKRSEWWPWSIRQAAVYHSFDLETGRSVWIMVKGNGLIRNRIMEATKGQNQGSMGSPSTPAKSFSLSLEVHLILCDWACEKWRWYIDFLHKQIQELTDGTKSYSPDGGLTTDSFMLQYSATAPSPNRVGTFDRLVRRFTGLSSHMPNHTPAAQAHQNMQPPDEKQENPTLQFDNVGTLQHLQEKVEEVLLVFEMDTKVLHDLLQYYMDSFKSDGISDNMRKECKTSLDRFGERIRGVASDFQMQKARLVRILGVVRDRKTLLHDILTYGNMRASKNSTDKMEKMTEEMGIIAKKTEQETEFMRIVTVVTLVFLPGTFTSTLMSTDIIRFENNRRAYSGQALSLYLSITFPLTILTLLCAFGYSYLRRGRKSQFVI
ncbi:hypothetical protein FQN52_008127 [Onygenales sp. PD_12]|nr:hypothetical protein FQN52_008127 [Onygenales sp. PD_12]